MHYTCKEIEPLLDAYFDGELVAGEMLTTKEHLGHCSDCQAKLIEIESVACAIAGLPRLRARTNLADQIVQTVKAQPTSQKKNLLQFKRKELLAAAAVVLLIGLVVGIMSSPTKLVQQPREVKLPQALTLEPEDMEVVKSPSASSKAVSQSVGKKTQKLLASGNALVKPTAPVEKLATATRGTEDMLAFDYGYQPNLMEGMGIATDEDGLYALKM